MATRAASKATERAWLPAPGPRTSSATAMMSEPPTISARSSDASTALDETRAGSFGSAEITNGSKNARPPAIETMTIVAF
jgi:hypothetical protein